MRWIWRFFSSVKWIWWWNVYEWRFETLAAWPWKDLARVRTLYSWSVQCGPLEFRKIKEQEGN
jgi:hypothetical protein